MVKKQSKKFESTKKRKFDDSWRYLYAFLIAVFLMGFGFLASYSISTYEFNKFSSLQEDVFYDFYKKQLIQKFFLDLNKCDPDYYEEMSEILDFQGGMLNKLEIELGKRDEEIMDKKENYFLLELSHYNFMREIGEECSFDNNFILFFYSNSEENTDNSERVGRILSNLKSMDSSVMIYSFDVNSESDLMKMVRSYYGVEEGAMTIIVNEEHKLTSLRKVDEILELLD